MTNTTEALNEHLNLIAPRLTIASLVTVDRVAAAVLIDGRPVRSFDPAEGNLMEEYADTLWTYVEDLKTAAAGWPV